MIKINSKPLKKAMTFNGGEEHIQLPDIKLGRGSDIITIDARITDSKELIKLMLVCNALRHRYERKYKVVLKMLYLPFSRQDRVCVEGEANSSEVMRDILKMCDVDEIICADIHSKQDLTDLNVKEITIEDIFVDNPHLLRGVTALVCPDQGAVHKILLLRDLTGLPVIWCSKVRDPKTGWITGFEILNGWMHIPNGNLLVVDDICDGGKTFEMLADEVNKKSPDKLSLYVTHGLFSKGLLDLYKRGYSEIFSTNSVISILSKFKKRNIVHL